MTFHSPDTEELVRRAGAGDAAAQDQLLARHRDRLRRMVVVRLDRRLAVRLDPSDFVKEVLVEASQRLPDYLQNRPLPYYPWLRQLAWERLVKLHRRHQQSQKRAPAPEATEALALPDASAVVLADRLAASGTSPDRRLPQQETRARVLAALQELPEREREVLVLRYLEQLSLADIAAVLSLSESAVKVRHFQAIDHLRSSLDASLGRGSGFRS